MRVYFEKPRTTIGWRGLILDPRLNGTGDIAEGLRMARKLLLEITALGIPAVLLFGLADKKDDSGSEAWDPNGAVQQAIKEIKRGQTNSIIKSTIGCKSIYFRNFRACSMCLLLFRQKSSNRNCELFGCSFSSIGFYQKFRQCFGMR